LILDLHSLTPPKTPNWHLAAPAAWHHPHAQATSPTFDVPVEVLREAVMAVAAQEPRCTLLTLDTAARQAEFEQRSRLFGFPDRIVAEFVELGEGGSSLALYSRALKGHSDMGVNRKRVERWLDALPEAVSRLRSAAPRDGTDLST
jgi:uncharacterized protein (DUF1499 family)